MVPIDVRVLDSAGNPITDLKAGDFTIHENGKRQELAHFSPVTFTTETREPGKSTAGDPGVTTGAGALKEQNRRVFLLLLGRGRVAGPEKAMEALADFVRTRLRPEDLVAVQIYNRATPFTDDHTAVARLLEHVGEQNAGLESALQGYFSGLRAEYGPTGIPPHIQQPIDALFSLVPTLAPKSALASAVPGGTQIERDARATADQLQRAAAMADRPAQIHGRIASLPDSEAANTAAVLDMTFDQYAAHQADLQQDTTNLFAGINYLRHLEGEKHLVFVTPRGISLPRMEQHQSLAAVAADGRIALNIIYTGGPAVAPRPIDLGPDRAYGAQMQAPFASPSRAFQQTFLVSDLREMTQLTGGQLAVYQDGAVAMDRIDRATAFQYLLGYHPSDATRDGRFRKIEIRVNRRGATVLYRRGYFASDRLVPTDRRQFVTATRIAEAAAADRDLTGIIVKVKKTAVEGRGDGRHLVVDLHVRAPRMHLVEQDGRRIGTINLELFVADGRQQSVGTLRQAIDLRLQPESVERFLAEGISYTSRVPINGADVYLKVVAYDYGADLVGTATRTLR